MFQPGTLFVVATPIGNLSDITLRALDVLKDVEYILSEDTRETSKILNKFDIQKQQISYRDENHSKVYGQILELLESGNNCALVSDSGTPLISDPGFKLVQELRNKNIKIVTIPGPNAAVAALSISGIPTDKFTFLGFLPKKASHIEKILNEFGAHDTTLVVYESPYRVKKLLIQINDVLGDRIVSLCRELTKVHEEVITDKVSNIIKNGFTEKGEFVVLIAKKGFSNE